MIKNISKKIIAGTFACALTLAAVGLINVEAAKEKETNTNIAESITIEGIDVGGMTETEAKEAVSEYVDGVNNAVITLKAGENSLDCTAQDLGLSTNVDEVVQQALCYGTEGNILERYVAKKNLESGKSKGFELTFSLDKNTVTSFLNDNIDTLNDEAQNGTLTHENGVFTYVEGKSGYCVIEDDSIDMLCSYINEEWDGSSSSVDLVCEVTEPQGSEKELSKIKDELGTFSTSYAGSDYGRKTNVELGASKVSGTVLYPGEEMSVSDKLGEQNAENGYAQAASYENGSVVQTYGGGVCQISTTLYNAVIRAELEVTERKPHSMMVGYVDPSEDAAIAEGSKDLKFVNNLDNPVYVEMTADGATLSASIYGVETRAANRTVEFESEVLSRTSPQTVYVSDSSLPIGYQSSSGSAHTGYKACLWKIVTVDGVEQSREKFNESSYKATNVTVTVGTGSADPEAAAQMEAAVASQDSGSIGAAQSTWNDEAVAERAATAEAEAQAAAAAATDPAAATTDAAATTTDAAATTDTTTTDASATDGAVQ